MEMVKVLRVILYTGTRKAVEETLSRSIHGERKFSSDLVVSAFSLNEFPEKLLTTEEEVINDILAEEN